VTYRERREARAERLRGWADKREAVAAATFKSHEVYRGDTAFNTQPGRIPERTRVNAQADRAFKSLRKAEGMSARADNIEAQAAGAIYSDDPDAIPALRERLTRLEAERDRIKAYNASCRRGARDLALLDEGQRLTLEQCAKFASYSLGKDGQMPGYALTNLSGNITRNRQRLERLEREAPTACQVCGAEVGDHAGEGPAGPTAIELPGDPGVPTVALVMPEEFLRLALVDSLAEQLDLLA